MSQIRVIEINKSKMSLSLVKQQQWMRLFIAQGDKVFLTGYRWIIPKKNERFRYLYASLGSQDISKKIVYIYIYTRTLHYAVKIFWKFLKTCNVKLVKMSKEDHKKFSDKNALYVYLKKTYKTLFC